MRYIFTVTAGRSGQETLAHLVTTYVDDCYAAFEEPAPALHFNGILGTLERNFRRRFVETHELLGRGKVLTAFADGDDAYLDHIAAKRLRLIHQKDAKIHFDVSKYFARGLHQAFARACPDLSLVLLIRDPILNMRSFLNRNKRFTLDNSLPDANRNQLQLPCDDFEKGELYLWAWCEMSLRYAALIDDVNIRSAIALPIEDLNDVEKMNAHFDNLNLPHKPVELIKARNTNAEQGKGDTVALEKDVELFERFLKRLPSSAIEKIPYLKNYDPRKSLLNEG